MGPKSAIAVVLLVAISLTLFACDGGGGGGGEPILNSRFVDLGAPIHTSVETADIDGDGLLDVVSVSNTLDPETVQANVIFQQVGGPGVFAPRIEFLIGNQPSLRTFHVVVADLNLNGQPDIIFSHTGAVGSGSPGNKLSVMLQDPTSAGQYFLPVSYDVGNLPRGIAVGDIDLDGLPDLVIATGDGVYLLRQNGGALGQFLAAIQLSTPPTQAVGIGDLDNDGLLDLAFDDNQAVQLLLNNPVNIGDFLTGPALSVGGSPSDLTLADLDADGRLDIVVSNFESSAADNRGSFSVLLQDPIIDAQFLPFIEYVTDQALHVHSTAVADLNGDLRPDIVGAVDSLENSDDKVVVLLQTLTGQGVFDPPVGYGFVSSDDPFQAVVGNLGPDTLPDIVVANALSGVYVLYQDPAEAGAFDPGIKIGEPL